MYLCGLHLSKKKKSDYFHIQHWLTCFQARDWKCLLGGTNWMLYILQSWKSLKTSCASKKPGFNPGAVYMRTVVKKGASSEVILQTL